MKKLFLLLTTALCMGATVYAQQPLPANILMDNQNIPGYTLLFNNADIDMVTNALAERLQKQAGLKSSKSLGYVAYLGQQLPEFGAGKFDIYTKVENEGKKKDRLVKLTFVVTKGNMNPLTNASDPQTITNIEKFLNDFVAYEKAYEIRTNIDQLNKEMIEQQKELNKLKDKKEKQEKALKDMNDDIEKRTNDLNKKQEDLDKANKSLRQAN